VDGARQWPRPRAYQDCRACRDWLWRAPSEGMASFL
jgi:hypothetical protein